MKLKFLKLTAAIVMTVAFTNCGEATASHVEKNSKDSSQTKPQTLPPGAVDNILPYTLEFIPKAYSNNLPRLQSYQLAVSPDGSWLVVGGRRQGLHTFKSAPATNFVKDSANNFLFVIDPTNGNTWSFDVNQLDGKYSAPFKATNAQSYYDRSTGQFYLVGGYGWLADGSNMATFNTIMRFSVPGMINAIKSGASAQQITSLIQLDQDDRFAVTGGELFNLNGAFYLVFGQKFMGQYRAFGGSDFSQKYTEEVRVFTLKPNTLKILSYGATTNKEADGPFHRRDGNIVDDINPATGKERITAFGGVFQPGIIGAYTYPVYINGPAAPTLARGANQKFSQYECPVILVYDSSAAQQSVYRTFFGGIGHYYYYQTASQKAVYDTATRQGRNDGFPFVEDITSFVETTKGQYSNPTYSEYIHVNPIPGNRLLGASIPFILNPEMYNQGKAYGNGVLKLSAFQPGSRTLIGYIYGGIEAQNPLPLQPNTGTFVSNTVFEVYLNYRPSAAIPAEQGHESTKNETNLKRK